MKNNAIAIGHKYMPQSLAWFEKNYIKTKRNKPPPNQPKQIKNWSTQALSPSQQIPDGPAAALYSMGTHFSLRQGDTGLLPLEQGDISRAIIFLILFEEKNHCRNADFSLLVGFKQKITQN